MIRRPDQFPNKIAAFIWFDLFLLVSILLETCEIYLENFLLLYI